MRTITVIPGDGIGPEVVESAMRCVDAVAEKYKFEVQWEVALAGENARKKFGTILPNETLSSIKKNRAALKGPITTPIGEGFRSVNVELRQRLGLFANVRPVKSMKGVVSRYPDVDLTVIRENTEDLYAGIEFDEGKKPTEDLIKFIEAKTGKVIPRDSAIAIKPISISASKRIAEFAFTYAKYEKRKKVTAIHKANIMKYADGLFLKTARAVAKKYPATTFEDMIVDNACMQLVTNPNNFDVLLCPNLYGDILSDLCAGLAGGLGIAPSANIGENCAIFEPVHGSAPKHAGKNDVNPSACILSAALMMPYIEQPKAAKALEQAVMKVIKARKVVTYDLKPKKAASTTEMTDEIIRMIK